MKFFVRAAVGCALVLTLLTACHKSPDGLGPEGTGPYLGAKSDNPHLDAEQGGGGKYTGPRKPGGVGAVNLGAKINDPGLAGVRGEGRGYNGPKHAGAGGGPSLGASSDSRREEALKGGKGYQGPYKPPK
jgi:hypothetical protein